MQRQAPHEPARPPLLIETGRTPSGAVVTEYRYVDSPPHRREVRAADGSWSASGDVTPSGKRHGKWMLLSRDAYVEQWYWYDEEISEGEWHLRNR